MKKLPPCPLSWVSAVLVELPPFPTLPFAGHRLVPQSVPAMGEQVAVHREVAKRPGSIPALTRLEQPVVEASLQPWFPPASGRGAERAIWAGPHPLGLCQVRGTSRLARVSAELHKALHEVPRSSSPMACTWLEAQAICRTNLLQRNNTHLEASRYWPLHSLLVAISLCRHHPPTPPSAWLRQLTALAFLLKWFSMQEHGCPGCPACLASSWTCVSTNWE